MYGERTPAALPKRLPERELTVLYASCLNLFFTPSAVVSSATAALIAALISACVFSPPPISATNLSTLISSIFILPALNRSSCSISSVAEAGIKSPSTASSNKSGVTGISSVVDVPLAKYFCPTLVAP